MTEAKWLAWDRPRPMLRLVGKKANARKLRLFACACARRVWGRISQKVGRRAVEVAEQFADGLATAEELSAARSALSRYLSTFGNTDGASTAYYTTVEDAYACARDTAEFGQETAAFKTNVDAATLEEGRRAEQRQQCDLLRCVFGPLPFRPPPQLNPAWLAWEAGTVPKLAASVYEERAFDRLPILADALEEAGCTESELLTHLRGPGPHVRGCWALDLLGGKE
jgi:hypothetical protein